MSEFVFCDARIVEIETERMMFYINIPVLNISAIYTHFLLSIFHSSIDLFMAKDQSVQGS